MKDYNELYANILDRIFGVGDFVGFKVKQSSQLTHYDHTTRTLNIQTTTNYAHKLLISRLKEIKGIFENTTGRIVDNVSLNGEIMYTDRKTLEDVVSEEVNVSNKEAKFIIETIEKTFENDMFTKHQLQDTGNAVIIKFYNRKTSQTRSVIYIKGDHRYQEDITKGYKLLPVFAGIYYLMRGNKRKKRMEELKRKISGLKLIKYEPVDRKSAKLVHEIMKMK